MSWTKINPETYEKLRDGHMANRRRQFIDRYLFKYKGSALDFGCGTGYDAFALANGCHGKDFVGVDTDRDFIDYANKKYQLENLTFDHTIFNYKPFGIVYSIDVLHHCHNLNAEIKDIYDNMKNDGIWIVIEPNIMNPYIFWHQAFTKNEELFFKGETEKLFRDIGFKIEKKGLFLLIPASIKKPGKILQMIEKLLEPFIGGSVYYVLKK